MTDYYQEDLAFIHDAGFGDFARDAAPGLFEIFARRGVPDGLVVDLGCGSGLWAEQLVGRGYRVIGIDISAAMIRLARRRVPQAEFRIASLFEAELPPCNAVTSLGECISYLFDPKHERGAGSEVFRLFKRIHTALAPGGIFIFDIMEPGELGRASTSRSFTEGDDWLVTIEKHEDREQRTLTRRITTFRKAGKCYRRADEIHRVQLYTSEEMTDLLRQAGFKARPIRRYGKYELRKARVAFIAQKTNQESAQTGTLHASTKTGPIASSGGSEKTPDSSYPSPSSSRRRSFRWSTTRRCGAPPDRIS